MNLPAVEALRHSLIAAQLRPDRSLRQLALHRFDAADRAIAACPPAQRSGLEDALFQMLPSEWPLWVESGRSLSPLRAN